MIPLPGSSPWFPSQISHHTWKWDHVLPLPKATGWFSIAYRTKSNLFRQNNKALHDLTFVPNSSPNSAFILHPNLTSTVVSWIQHTHIFLLLGATPSKAGVESTCTWISGMWGMQNRGPVVKGLFGKSFPWNTRRFMAKGPCICILQIEYPLHSSEATLRWLWKMSGVPTLPTNLCCLPVCSLGSAERHSSHGWIENPGLRHCSVSGLQVRVWPLGKNRLIPTLSYHLPGALEMSLNPHFFIWDGGSGNNTPKYYGKEASGI